MTPVSATHKLAALVQLGSRHRLSRMAALRFAVLVALLASASVVEITHLQSSVSDATFWRQLQVGNWIIAHRAVPHFGIFSQSSELPWADPNWGFQLALASLYRLVGTRVFPIGVMAFRMLFALATFILAGGRRGNFWLAIVVSLWAQIALLSSSLPAPGCSAILFALELVLLFRSRASGQQNLLYWMPLLIVVWANLDWHFVLGVVVLCLFCGVGVIEPPLQNGHWHFSLGGRRALPPALLALTAGATGISSLITPCFYHSYVTAWHNLFGVSQRITSLATKSMNFREPQHYLVMLLAMCAFLALGRRQARDLFQVLLLAVSASLGFAFRTEAWVVVIVSVAVIGEFLVCGDAELDKRAQISRTVVRAAAALAAVILIVAATRIPSPESLLKVAANKLPVRACDFIRQNHLPGPIYNEMEWGDFLVWYLPEYPVSMDGRYELYGEARTARYYGVTRGLLEPSSDPAFAAANTILLSASSGLIRGPDLFPNVEEIFRSTFPGFHEVYHDDLAVVLTRQP
jgi:hypothetical protein